jgi:anti-anti-sigma factor
MAEPAVRSLLIEVEHGVRVCILRLKGHFRTGESRLYISDKADEIRSHNCINMVADVSELVSIGSMGLGFLVGICVSVTKKAGGGGFILAGANERVQAVLDTTRLCTIIPSAPDLPSALAALSRKRD